MLPWRGSHPLKDHLGSKSNTAWCNPWWFPSILDDLVNPTGGHQCNVLPGHLDLLAFIRLQQAHTEKPLCPEDLANPILDLRLVVNMLQLLKHIRLDISNRSCKLQLQVQVGACANGIPRGKLAALS